MSRKKRPLLEVRRLRITTAAGLPLVEEVSFDVSRGRTVAIAGESGCGKSLVAQAVMGVLPDGMQVFADRMRWNDGDAAVDLMRAPPSQRRGLMGAAMGMVWQDPLAALTPVLTVGAQLEEVLVLHHGHDAPSAKSDALARLERVGLEDPESAAASLPHELSGGMRQRAVIALALAGDPSLLIADEPTTALDPSTQVRVLDVLAQERERRGLALLLITHDLGVVSACADEVNVVYAGRTVESGPSDAVLSAPRHPYGLGLLSARGSRAGRRFTGIAGAVPVAAARPAGCAFEPRCPFAEAACGDGVPELESVGEGRRVACAPVVKGRIAPAGWPGEGRS